MGNLKIGGKLADVIRSVHETVQEAERWERGESPGSRDRQASNHLDITQAQPRDACHSIKYTTLSAAHLRIKISILLENRENKDE